MMALEHDAQVVRTITTSPMNPPRLHLRKIFALGVVTLLITLGVLYYFLLGRSPLIGEMAHDFGLVPVEEGGTRVEHIFTLKNRTSSILTITDTKTSCGCAVAEISTNQLEPGETVHIRATLKLTGSRLKQESIYLLLEGYGMRQITLRARGRSIQKLRSEYDFIYSPPREDTRFQVFAEQWEEDSHAPPLVSASPGVRAVLEEWKEVRTGNGREGRPALWVAGILVNPSLDAGEPREVEITLEEGKKLTLHLRLEGGDTAAGGMPLTEED